MILAAVWYENPAVVGLIIAIPATVLGYLGYRRSQGVDEATKQAGIAAGQATSIGQVVEGLNSVIANVQGDNEVLRREVIDIRGRLDAIEAGNVDLRAKNIELTHEISVLHDENDALKIENGTLKDRIGELEKVKEGGTQ